MPNVLSAARHFVAVVGFLRRRGGCFQSKPFCTRVEEQGKLIVSETEDDTRLDRFLRRRIGRLPQSLLEKYIRRGVVKIDGQVVKKAGERVRSSSVVYIPRQLESLEETTGDDNVDDMENNRLHEGDGAMMVERKKTALSTQVTNRVQSWVLYKDNNLLVINKPPNLACQGGSGLKDTHLGTLLPALSLDNEEPPKLVHRLDKEVSGTLLLARNAFAAKRVALLFQQRQIAKVYWALVIGNPLPTQGEIRKAVDEKAAVTRYRVVKKLHSVASWLELEPITGRKRQLRIHCAQVLHCPIFGDEKHPPLDEATQGKYRGLSHLLMQRDKPIYLHAHSISFPTNIEENSEPKRWKTIVAPLPFHMENAWNILGFSQNNAY